MTTRDLRMKKAGLIAQARQLVDLADKEKRSMSAEEETSYSTIMDEVNKLTGDIQRREGLEALEASLAGGNPQGAPHPEITPPDTGKPGEGRASKAYEVAYRNYLKGGLQGLTGEDMRALQSDNDALGGYLKAPITFVNQLLKAVDDIVFVRQQGTPFQVTNSDGLGVPTLEADPADSDWTSELKTGSEDSSMTFGKREFKPYPLAKRLKVSRKLLRQVPDVDGLVVARLAYKFGITKEKAYMTGHGAQQPLGLFTASNDGIPTSRDVSTGNGTTYITFDGLIEAKYTLKGAYWPKARWTFHRDAVKMLAKIKDGEGQYIWKDDGVKAGEPASCLSFPVNMSEYAPNTFTNALYVGLLGDISYYWYADSLNFDLQRLLELYAETNQIGFIAREESDGMPVLAEAFVRVKLAP